LAGIVRGALVVSAADPPEIQAGRIGSRVPSAMQLAGDTGASVATVKRAFKVLHNEGVIYSVNGRGTFVKPRS
jgi:DNA-binding GntR family transcriptional regulator